MNVNAIGPTSIETPMNAELFADPEWRESALKKIPAGRFRTRTISWALCSSSPSPASDMVHGHLLLVDGGGGRVTVAGSARRLRIGLIGAGDMSRYHLAAWAKVPEATVVAISDRTRERAESRAREFGIARTFADPEA